LTSNISTACYGQEKHCPERFWPTSRSVQGRSGSWEYLERALLDFGSTIPFLDLDDIQEWSRYRTTAELASKLEAIATRLVRCRTFHHAVHRLGIPFQQLTFYPQDGQTPIIRPTMSRTGHRMQHAPNSRVKASAQHDNTCSLQISGCESIPLIFQTDCNLIASMRGAQSALCMTSFTGFPNTDLPSVKHCILGAFVPRFLSQFSQSPSLLPHAHPACIP